jgi:hypothetical protein
MHRNLLKLLVLDFAETDYFTASDKKHLCGFFKKMTIGDGEPSSSAS